ncbi:hypothetical protein ES707_15803 [subsurface metagenome]
MNLFETKANYQSGAFDKRKYIKEMHRLHERLFEYAKFIRDTDIARIEITDGTVVMTSRAVGIKILCDARDMRIAPIETLNFGTYEIAELEMMLRLIKPGYTVFDIGANIGWHSINIAKSLPDASVFAFEPIPETFAYLKKNVEMNGVSNVQLYNFGFFNEEKELKFYFCDDSSASTSIANIEGRDDARIMSCSVRKLDDFVAEHDLKVNFIKCDVEGAELFVFQGGMESIRRHKPIILSEMVRKWCAKFDYSPNKIIDLISGAGYKCFTVKGSKLVEFFKMDDNTVETNFFFLDPDEHAKYIQSLVAG